MDTFKELKGEDMLTLGKVKLLTFLVVSSAISLSSTYSLAYKCTFINKTHAIVSVTFYRMKTDMKSHGSGEFIIKQKSEATWNAGKTSVIPIPYSIFGMKINYIKYKDQTVSGSENFKKEMWDPARPANFQWVLEEELIPDAEGKTSQLKFVLYRTPAGFQGSTYPGGAIATFGPINIK